MFDIRNHAASGSKFIAVGLMNTTVGLSVIWACKWLLGLNDFKANLVGYIVGFCFSFCLNRAWTFRDHGSITPALARFLCAFAVAYPINLLTVMTLIHYFQVDGYVAQVLGIPPYSLAFYAFSHRFVFRDR
jgi:putative flippase GtrA